MGHDRYHIGIDVGGTFTDIVVWDRTDGSLTLHKVPTTPHDIASGISAALGKSGAPAAEMAEIAHGTTVATNALLERKGARTGLLTTVGFRDLLELRDGARRSLRGWQPAFEPVIPRQWRWEAAERVDARGTVLRALVEEDFAGLVSALKAQDIEALAICSCTRTGTIPTSGAPARSSSACGPVGRSWWAAQYAPFPTSDCAPPPPPWGPTSRPS